jgi:hypothetical protein
MSTDPILVFSILVLIVLVLALLVLALLVLALLVLAMSMVCLVPDNATARNSVCAPPFKFP